MIRKLEEIVESVWGYTEYKALQRDAMVSVTEGRDSLVVLPTGGGKSLCYQAPALAMDGLALVVSPLISLMKDQVDALRLCGVEAASINSALDSGERRQVHEAIRRGTLKILYVAPERITTPGFIDYIRERPVSFVAIDEAHCISQWGHDFRPDYRELKVLREAFPDVGFHGYTATATAQVREDICLQLDLKNPEVLVGDFDRPNLVYHATRRQGGYHSVYEQVARHKGESGIVYCISRKKVEKLCSELRAQGHRALPYHAGLDQGVRKANQDAFARDEVDIIVATVAFGMGIDKSNVRFVFHAEMPKSIEHYQQEAGRAGRDGLEAECHLFYSASDLVLWQRIMADGEGEAAAAANSKLTLMMDYCSTVGCRHKALSAYFGQALSSDDCGACDMCLGGGDLVEDALAIGQKIISCVKRLGSFAGPSYTTLVLTGSNEQRVRDKGHDQLSVWGILAEFGVKDVRDWIEQLASQGCLRKEGEYNVLATTQEGKEVLAGARVPRLLAPVRRTPMSRNVRAGDGVPTLFSPTRKTPEKKTSRIAKESWEGVDRELFEVLRGIRLGAAHERNVPAFVIFSDRTLREMARVMPTTSENFRSIHGVGAKKWTQFGTLFLEAIRSYRAEKGLRV